MTPAPTTPHEELKRAEPEIPFADGYLNVEALKRELEDLQQKSKNASALPWHVLRDADGSLTVNSMSERYDKWENTVFAQALVNQWPTLHSVVLALLAEIEALRAMAEQDLQSVVDAFQEGYNQAVFVRTGDQPFFHDEWQEAFAGSGASNYVAARNHSRAATIKQEQEGTET